MDVDRRVVIQVLAMSPLAAAAPTLAANTAFAATSPLCIISNVDAEHAGFLRGARNARRLLQPLEEPSVLRSDLGLDFVAQLRGRLTDHTPTRIIGMVDDATAAIVIGLARSADVDLHWLGQHRCVPDQQRHTLVRASDNVCSRLVALLQDCSDHHRSLPAWAEMLGSTLAGLDSTPLDPSARPATLLHRSFVSFSFDTRSERHHG